MNENTTASPDEESVPDHLVIRRSYTQFRATCNVSFYLPAEVAPDARRVTVVGSFNGWDPNAHPMQRQNNGDYLLVVELEAGKEYEFRFLIDGTRWENAWNADKYKWCNYAKCENSVVVV